MEKLFHNKLFVKIVVQEMNNFLNLSSLVPKVTLNLFNFNCYVNIFSTWQLKIKYENFQTYTTNPSSKIWTIILNCSLWEVENCDFPEFVILKILTPSCKKNRFIYSIILNKLYFFLNMNITQNYITVF